MDAIAQVKFFTPWSDWTWYAVEYNPDAKLFYGLVDGFEKEVGYWDWKKWRKPGVHTV